MDKRLLKVISHCVVAIIMIVIASCISCVPLSSVQETQVSSSYLKNISKSAVFIEVTRLVDITQLKLVDREPLVPLTSSGSGAVVAIKGKNSLVLTAAHVCHDENIFTTKDPNDETKQVNLPVMLTAFNIVNALGESFHASVKVKDIVNDICILEVQGIAGQAIKVATKLPEIGSKIVYVGAPGGVWIPPAVPIFEGRYDGIAEDSDTPLGKELFTAPVYPGASGSAIVCNGQVIGVLIQGYTSFPLIGFAAHLTAVKDILKQAQG